MSTEKTDEDCSVVKASKTPTVEVLHHLYYPQDQEERSRLISTAVHFIRQQFSYGKQKTQ